MIRTFTVVLDHDYREDHVRPIQDALRMVKGVLSVEPHSETVNGSRQRKTRALRLKDLNDTHRYGIDFAAQVIGRSPYTVRDLAKAGKLVGFKVGKGHGGGKWRFTGAELKRFCLQRQNPD